jgi:hypothetical protein
MPPKKALHDEPRHEGDTIEIHGDLGGVQFDLKLGGAGGRRPVLALLDALLGGGEEPPKEEGPK